MKAYRKVIESVTVAALALALTVTAVTIGGESAATDKRAQATELEKNGIAGVAAVRNEYELEAADELDMAVSVEREAVDVVAASAEETDVVKAVNEEVTAEPEEELTEEERDWQDKLMADVDEFLYVRAEADGESKVVGKLYKGDRALIKKTGESWTRIVSGNVKGYVKNEYCLFGLDALKYAKKTCDTVAKVTTNGLRIRKAPDADAGVVKSAASGDVLIVDSDADAVDGWVAVSVDSKTCYVSTDYVQLSLSTGKAITIEEELAEQKAAQQKEKEESRNTSSGQTTATNTTQGPSLAASADEETLLAAIIQCEAGGLSQECMTAVGAVVLNRVRSGSFPNSIYKVIYQRGQFGPAHNGRLEQRLSNGVSSGARRAAQAALAGSDPTGGAKYFKLASSGHAGVVIGPIVFY